MARPSQPWNNLLLMVIMIWIQVGFAMVVLSAAIKSIPEEIIEAARIDGANEFQVFWRIVVPSIAPTIVVVSTYMVINSLKVFDIVFVMGNAEANKTEVIAERMIRWFFISNNDGRGAAIAVVLFIAVVPVLHVERQAVPRAGEDPMSLAAPPAPPEVSRSDSSRRGSRSHQKEQPIGVKKGGWFVRITILVDRRHLAHPDDRCAGHVVPSREPRRHDRLVDGARPSVPSRAVDARELPDGARRRGLPERVCSTAWR